MVGGSLDVFYSLGVFVAELLDNVVENIAGVQAQGRNFINTTVIGEGLEPAHLNKYTVAYQTIFTEDGTQVFCFAAISSIDRGDGGKGREFHVIPVFIGCRTKGRIIALWGVVVSG